MASCEKCWQDAGGDPGRYSQLLEDRGGLTGGCTPEQQAGPDASECPNCKRMTVHQHAHVCMVCNWRPARTEG